MDNISRDTYQPAVYNVEFKRTNVVNGTKLNDRTCECACYMGQAIANVI